MRMLIFITTLLLLYSCDSNKINTIDKENYFAKYLRRDTKTFTNPQLKEFSDFHPVKINLVEVDGWRNKVEINEIGKSIEITDSSIVSAFTSLISTSYNIRYCCCPIQDYKIVIEGKQGNQITLFADTISSKNEMIIFPSNYNFCIKTQIDLLSALTDKTPTN